MNFEDKHYTISENIYSEKASQGSFCSMLSSRDWENNLLSQVIHETIQQTIVDGRTPTSNNFNRLKEYKGIRIPSKEIFVPKTE